MRRWSPIGRQILGSAFGESSRAIRVSHVLQRRLVLGNMAIVFTPIKFRAGARVSGPRLVRGCFGCM
jgi:hypothetical protein